MTNQDLYYTAPPDPVFDDIKIEATRIWAGYDDTHGYATEKIDRIKSISNIEDNWMYMYAMFDSDNQQKLLKAVQPETRTRILAAIL